MMTVVSLTQNKFGANFKKNKHLIFFSAVFILFFIIGISYISGKSDLPSAISKLFEKFLNERKSVSFFKIFFSSLLGRLLFISVMFVFGMSVAGVFVSPISISVLGIYYGVFLGYVYKTYLLTGIGFSALVVLAPSVMYVYAFFLAAREVFGFSKLFFSSLSKKSPAADYYSAFRLYSAHFVAVLLLTAFSALLDAVLSFAFLGLFNF